jgi:DeoR/GlpR family transcriptional regulator of sugar metabolism
MDCEGFIFNNYSSFGLLYISFTVFLNDISLVHMLSCTSGCHVSRRVVSGRNIRNMNNNIVDAKLINVGQKFKFKVSVFVKRLLKTR